MGLSRYGQSEVPFATGQFVLANDSCFICLYPNVLIGRRLEFELVVDEHCAGSWPDRRRC
jgi:hypothetical protein